MAVESRTVTYLVSRVNYHLANTATASAAMTSEIKSALGWALRDVVFRSTHPAFRTEASVSASSGTSDYDLASDFAQLIDPGVRHNADAKETLELISMQDYDQVDGSKMFESNARPAYYTLIGRNASTGHQQIRLIPTPDASYTIKYRYMAIPDDINATTGDSTELDERFPREHVEAIVLGAVTRFPQYLENDHMGVFLRMYDEAVRKLRSDAKQILGQQWQSKRHRMAGGRPIGHRFSNLTGYSD